MSREDTVVMVGMLVVAVLFWVVVCSAHYVLFGAAAR